MAERGMFSSSKETMPIVAPTPIANPGENVVFLDDYRRHLDRDKTMQLVAEAALTFSMRVKFSPVPLIIEEHNDGDTTVIFSESESGFYGDDHATARLNGWSGGPETERMVIVHHDSTTDIAAGRYLDPRNLRYVQESIRRQQYLGGFEEKLQALQNAVREKKELKEQQGKLY